MATNQKGAYLPSTQVWDPGNIENIEASASLKELLVRMYQNLGNMATMINYKETGIYPTEEFVCGKLYFKAPGLDSSTPKTPKLRQVYRKVINWNKPLPNAGSDTVAHGLTFDANTILIDCYAGSTDPVAIKLIKIPWVADLGDNIAIWADANNINIKTFATDRRNFTITYVVIEYLKF